MATSKKPKPPEPTAAEIAAEEAALKAAIAAEQEEALDGLEFAAGIAKTIFGPTPTFAEVRGTYYIFTDPDISANVIESQLKKAHSIAKGYGLTDSASVFEVFDIVFDADDEDGEKNLATAARRAKAMLGTAFVPRDILATYDLVYGDDEGFEDAEDGE